VVLEQGRIRCSAGATRPGPRSKDAEDGLRTSSDDELVRGVEGDGRSGGSGLVESKPELYLKILAAALGGERCTPDQGVDRAG
jgi:hypothetical protein